MTFTDSLTTEMEQGSGGQQQGPHEQHDAEPKSPTRAESWRRHVVSVVLVTLSLLVGFGSGFGSGVAISSREEQGDSAKTSTSTNTKKDSSFSFDDRVNASQPNDTSDLCSDLKMDLRAAASVIAKRYIDMHRQEYYIDGNVNRETMATRGVESNVRSTTSQRSSFSNIRYKGTTKPSLSYNRRLGDTEAGSAQESDTAQSNGTHFFLIYGNEIVVVNAATMTVSSRSFLPHSDPGNFNVLGLLLIDDRLLVFVRDYNLTTVSYDTYGTTTTYRDRTPEMTTVRIFDTTTMAVLTKETLPGDYVSAHAIGTNVYVTTKTPFSFYGFEQALEPTYIQSLTTAALDADSYRAKAQDELELQLELFVDSVTSDMDCSAVTRLPSLLFANASYTMMSESSCLATISSFDVTWPRFVNTTKVLLPQDWKVIMSEDRLVVVGTMYGTSRNGDEAELSSLQTFLVSFAVLGTAVASPLTGVVPGIVDAEYGGVDIFKADETYYLRVLSIGNDIYAESLNPILPPQLSILEMTDGGNKSMPLVGVLTDLGTREGALLAFSTLFQGERAFVALSIVANASTTNSFYSINMSDTTQPRTMGILETPGDMTYLKAVGMNLILAVGGYGHSLNWQESTDTLQLSLFDVTDLKGPRLIDEWSDDSQSDTNTTKSIVIGDSLYSEYGNSNDIRYLPCHRILVVPMTVTHSKRRPCADDDMWWNSRSREGGPQFTSDVTVGNETVCYQDQLLSTSFDGFRLFKINATSGITEYFSWEQEGYGFNYDNCHGAGLFARSFVLNSSIVTTRGNTVTKHNLWIKLEATPEINLKEGADLNCSF